MSQSFMPRIAGGALVGLAALVAALNLVSCTSRTSTTSTVRTDSTAATPALAGEAQLARGHYLVVAGSCGDCHTPGTLYGAPDSTRAFSGSEVGWTGPWGTVYAANLTPDSTGLASWSAEDIVNAIQHGRKPDGSPVQPPMPWPNLANLTSEDAHAIAAYLKSVPPVHHVVPKLVPPGHPVRGSIVFPPPGAWDAPRGGAPGGGPPGGAPPPPPGSGQ